LCPTRQYIDLYTSLEGCGVFEILHRRFCVPPEDPTNIEFEFVVGEKTGKRTPTIRDGQHEYVFTEVA
jgi:hypothetical protein